MSDPSAAEPQAAPGRGVLVHGRPGSSITSHRTCFVCDEPAGEGGWVAESEGTPVDEETWLCGEHFSAAVERGVFVGGELVFLEPEAGPPEFVAAGPVEEAASGPEGLGPDGSGPPSVPGPGMVWTGDERVDLPAPAPSPGAVVLYRDLYAELPAIIVATATSRAAARGRAFEDVDVGADDALAWFPTLDGDDRVHLAVLVPDPSAPVRFVPRVPRGSGPGEWRWPT